MRIQAPRGRAVLCIGETMAMVAPATAEAVEEAVAFRVEAGGAESNVAARLAALGHRAAWRGRLGDDPMGRRVATAIERRGVETAIEWDAEHPTGMYVKDPGTSVHYYRAGSAASHATPALLDGVVWADVALLHLTGITPALSAGCLSLVDAALDRAERGGVPTSFDVNYRPSLWRASEAAVALLAIARRADLVFVGLDEAAALWGCERPHDVRAFLTSPILVVKDGGVGATLFDGDASTFEPAASLDLVEAVGAGDAFAAGVLAAMLGGGSPADALREGHAAAATVLATTADM